MVQVTLSMGGMDAVVARMRSIPQRTADAFTPVLLRGGAMVEADAKSALNGNANGGGVDVGLLRASITTRVLMTSPTVLISQTGPNVPYGEAVERGTKPHMPPVSALLTWVQHKNRGSEQRFRYGADEQTVNIATAIQHSMRKKGRKPPPLEVLIGWVKSKGLTQTKDQQDLTAAWGLAMYIREHGTRPIPYLLPAWEKNRGAILGQLQGSLSRLLAEGAS